MRGEPAWRRLFASLALLSLTAPACNPILGPQPLDTNWRVHEGPRVTFFVRPGSAAEQNVARLSEVIEEQYTSTVRTLGLSYAGHVRAYAYESAADLDAESSLSGTAYPETESFRFVCAAPINANTFGLMGHEANHVFIIAGLGRGGTHFMTEGLASAVLSTTFYPYGRQFLYPWTKSHRAQIPTLTTVVDDGGFSKTDSEVAYNTSASFLAWLLETYGADKLRAIYDAKSGEVPTRIAAVYGRPLESLEQDWLRFCDAWMG